MRLSEWRARSPAREAMTAKVLAVVEPVLAALGAGRDPDCWVVWGEEPATRYAILVATPAGLVTCHVRANLPQEGPRASAKLSRWNRVQLGELGIETQGAHRLLSFQVESQILRGVDAEADAIAAFALRLIAAIDGRLPPEAAPARARPGRSATRTAAKAARAGTTGPKAGPAAKTGPTPKAAKAGPTQEAVEAATTGPKARPATPRRAASPRAG
jgi:hypothetical protein